MMRSLTTAATGMIAQETKMNVVAHNLANANTAGYKKVRAEFEDLLYERLQTAEAQRPEGGGRPSPLESGLGVRVASTSRSFAMGALINTQNPLDVAIEGSGFYQVRMQDGDIAYTRAGNLRIDGDGRVVTQQGLPIEPEIRIPQEAIEVTFGKDGQVNVRLPSRDESISVGQIELALFQNPGGMEAMGDTLLRRTEASGQPLIVAPGNEGSGPLQQGFLEGSNVTTVEEMIDLITTQRAYEMNSKVIQSADQMLQKLTNLR
jgi:flagellar basal-body rod protein FlgG